MVTLFAAVKTLNDNNNIVGIFVLIAKKTRIFQKSEETFVEQAPSNAAMALQVAVQNLGQAMNIAADLFNNNKQITAKKGRLFSPMIKQVGTIAAHSNFP